MSTIPPAFYGPYSAVENRSAMLCLTKSGTVRLLYQNRDVSWMEQSTAIEEAPPAVDRSITHAAFAPQSGL
jgi:mediator of RNA polymerase II transcription subunit 16, fungi type